MLPAPHFDSLELLLAEVDKKDGSVYRRKLIENWLTQCETKWDATDRSDQESISLGKEILFLHAQLCESVFCNMDGLFYLANLASLQKAYSSLIWEAILRNLSTMNQKRSRFGGSIHSWYLERFLLLFWKAIVDEFYSKSGLDLCNSSNRESPLAMLLALIEWKSTNEEVSNSLSKLLGSILAECHDHSNVPELTEFVKQLSSVTTTFVQPNEEWLQWCQKSISIVEAKPNPEWFPVNAFVRPMPIHPDELQRIDDLLVLSRQNWDGFGCEQPEIENWIKHLKSSKCKEPIERILNHLVLRLAIVRCYKEASGNCRLLISSKHDGPLTRQIFAFEKIIGSVFNRSKSMHPDDFAVHLACLPVLKSIRHPPWSRLVKIWDNYLSEHPLAASQLSAMQDFYKFGERQNADTYRRSLKSWREFEARAIQQVAANP